MEYYICGPRGMMDYITSGLEAKGIEKKSIHTESFHLDINQNELYEEEILRKELTANKNELLIEFRRSGKKLFWDQRYRSILEFAEANDIEISSGCLFGDCGTCLTKIHQGEIKYIHSTLVQPANGRCLPCSCIPVSNIVLDV
jgi:ferredoxin